MTWLLPYVASIAGFVLAAALAIVILRERRPPASTLAWLLLIAFAPWLGVPAYLALGGRKLHQRSRGKPGLRLADGAAPEGAAVPADPLARVLVGAGVGLPSPGNDVRWHASGEDAFAELCRVIDGAARSIRVATFVLGDDDVGRDITDRLAARARSGIEVCVLVDGLLARRARHLLADLRAAGARTAVFLPLIKLPLRGRSNLRNHRKAVIVDGETAILGGRNLAGEYLGPTPRADRWRDLSLTVAGPAVALIDEVFRADWQFAHGPALAGVGPAPARGDIEVHVVPSGPDVSGDPVYEALLHVVFTAQRRLWIATPYFAPDQALERGLELAVRRGVDVRLVVPRRSNHALADLGDPRLPGVAVAPRGDRAALRPGHDARQAGGRRRPRDRRIGQPRPAQPVPRLRAVRGHPRRGIGRRDHGAVRRPGGRLRPDPGPAPPARRRRPPARAAGLSRRPAYGIGAGAGVPGGGSRPAVVPVPGIFM